MTVDTPTNQGHHDSPEVVATRQLVGLWLFIAGDAVILLSLLFTYLYLRGLNTASQWMPKGVHGTGLVLEWGIVVIAAVSAWAIWSGEKAVVRGKSAIGGAWLATLFAVVGAVLCGVSIADIPHYVNATSQVRMVAGSYASSLLAIDVSNIVHLLLLVFLGVAVAVRSKKGLISQTSPTHARLIRIFWVWVTVSIALAALITTVFVASPK